MYNRFQQKVTYTNPNITVSDELIEKFFLIIKTGKIDEISKFVIDNRIKLNIVQPLTKKTPAHAVLELDDHIADDESKLNILKYLRDMESPLDLPDKDNVWPIHIAARLQNKEIIDLLVKSGAQLSHRDSSGNTPLHYATFGHDTACPIERGPGPIIPEQTVDKAPISSSLKDINKTLMQTLINNSELPDTYSRIIHLINTIAKIPDMYKGTDLEKSIIEDVHSVFEKISTDPTYNSGDQSKQFAVLEQLSDSIYDKVKETLKNSLEPLPIKPGAGGWSPVDDSKPEEKILPDVNVRKQEIKLQIDNQKNYITDPGNFPSTRLITNTIPEIEKIMENEMEKVIFDPTITTEKCIYFMLDNNNRSIDTFTQEIANCITREYKFYHEQGNSIPKNEYLSGVNIIDLNTNIISFLSDEKYKFIIKEVNNIISYKKKNDTNYTNLNNDYTNHTEYLKKLLNTFKYDSRYMIETYKRIFSLKSSCSLTFPMDEVYSNVIGNAYYQMTPSEYYNFYETFVKEFSSMESYTLINTVDIIDKYLIETLIPSKKKIWEKLYYFSLKQNNRYDETYYKYMLQLFINYPVYLSAINFTKYIDDPDNFPEYKSFMESSTNDVCILPENIRNRLGVNNNDDLDKLKDNLTTAIKDFDNAHILIQGKTGEIFYNFLLGIINLHPVIGPKVFKETLDTFFPYFDNQGGLGTFLIDLIIKFAKITDIKHTKHTKDTFYITPKLLRLIDEAFSENVAKSMAITYTKDYNFSAIVANTRVDIENHTQRQQRRTPIPHPYDPPFVDFGNISYHFKTNFEAIRSIFRPYVDNFDRFVDLKRSEKKRPLSKEVKNDLSKITEIVEFKFENDGLNKLLNVERQLDLRKLNYQMQIIRDEFFTEKTKIIYNNLTYETVCAMMDRFSVKLMTWSYNEYCLEKPNFKKPKLYEVEHFIESKINTLFTDQIGEKESLNYLKNIDISLSDLKKKKDYTDILDEYSEKNSITSIIAEPRKYFENVQLVINKYMYKNDNYVNDTYNDIYYGNNSYVIKDPGICDLVNEALIKELKNAVTYAATEAAAHAPPIRINYTLTNFIIDNNLEKAYNSIVQLQRVNYHVSVGDGVGPISGNEIDAILNTDYDLPVRKLTVASRKCKLSLTNLFTVTEMIVEAIAKATVISKNIKLSNINEILIISTHYVVTHMFSLGDDIINIDITDFIENIMDNINTPDFIYQEIGVLSNKNTNKKDAINDFCKDVSAFADYLIKYCKNHLTHKLNDLLKLVNSVKDKFIKKVFIDALVFEQKSKENKIEDILTLIEDILTLIKVITNIANDAVEKTLDEAVKLYENEMNRIISVVKNKQSKEEYLKNNYNIIKEIAAEIAKYAITNVINSITSATVFCDIKTNLTNKSLTTQGRNFFTNYNDSVTNKNTYLYTPVPFLTPTLFYPEFIPVKKLKSWIALFKIFDFLYQYITNESYATNAYVEIFSSTIDEMEAEVNKRYNGKLIECADVIVLEKIFYRHVKLTIQDIFKEYYKNLFNLADKGELNITVVSGAPLPAPPLAPPLPTFVRNPGVVISTIKGYFDYYVLYFFTDLTQLDLAVLLSPVTYKTKDLLKKVLGEGARMNTTYKLNDLFKVWFSKQIDPLKEFLNTAAKELNEIKLPEYDPSEYQERLLITVKYIYTTYENDKYANLLDMLKSDNELQNIINTILPPNFRINVVKAACFSDPFNFLGRYTVNNKYNDIKLDWYNQYYSSFKINEYFKKVKKINKYLQYTYDISKDITFGIINKFYYFIPELYLPSMIIVMIHVNKEVFSFLDEVLQSAQYGNIKEEHLENIRTNISDRLTSINTTMSEIIGYYNRVITYINNIVSFTLLDTEYAEDMKVTNVFDNLLLPFDRSLLNFNKLISNKNIETLVEKYLYPKTMYYSIDPDKTTHNYNMTNLILNHGGHVTYKYLDYVILNNILNNFVHYLKNTTAPGVQYEITPIDGKILEITGHGHDISFVAPAPDPAQIGIKFGKGIDEVLEFKYTSGMPLSIKPLLGDHIAITKQEAVQYALKEIMAKDEYNELKDKVKKLGNENNFDSVSNLKSYLVIAKTIDNMINQVLDVSLRETINKWIYSYGNSSFTYKSDLPIKFLNQKNSYKLSLSSLTTDIDDLISNDITTLSYKNLQIESDPDNLPFIKNPPRNRDDFLHYLYDSDYFSNVNTKNGRKCYIINTKTIESIIDPNSINAQNYDNMTPLHYAVQIQHPELVKIIIAKGGKPEQYANKNLKTPLSMHISIFKRHLDIINGDRLYESVSKFSIPFNNLMESRLKDDKYNKNIISNITLGVPVEFCIYNHMFFSYMTNYRYNYTIGIRDAIYRVIRTYTNVKIPDTKIIYPFDLFDIDEKNLEKILIDNDQKSRIYKDANKLNSKKIAAVNEQLKMLDNQIMNLIEQINKTTDENQKKLMETLNLTLMTKKSELETNKSKSLEYRLDDKVLSSDVIYYKIVYEKMVKNNIELEMGKNITEFYNNTFKKFTKISSVSQNIWKNYIDSNNQSSMIFVNICSVLSYILKNEDIHSSQIKNDMKVIDDFMDCFTKYIQMRDRLPYTLDDNPILEEEVSHLLYIVDLLLSEAVFKIIVSFIYDSMKEMDLNQMLLKSPSEIINGFIYSTYEGYTLEKYIKEVLPKKAIKYFANIFQTNYDPDKKIANGTELFNPIIALIKSNSITKLDESSIMIQNFRNYMIPFLLNSYQVLIIHVRMSMYGYERYLLNTHNMVKICMALTAS